MFFLQKNKNHKISLCIEILNAESFKLIPHMLAWDALKESQIFSDQKVLRFTRALFTLIILFLCGKAICFFGLLFM